MHDKTISMLSLCRKAGKLRCGFDPVVDAVHKGDAVLVLTTRDLSERSRRGIDRVCEEWEAKRLELPYEMDDIEHILGRRAGIIAVCDPQFARQIDLLLTQREGEESL